MFDIYLTKEIVPEGDPGVEAVYGKIRLGAHSETFIASLVFWTSERYEQHWKVAVRRLIRGEDRSVLITSYIEPNRFPDEHLIWWPLYRVGTTVYIQNQLLFFDRLSRPFSVADPWTFVQARRTVNDDGDKISEWSVPIASFAEFLARRR
jgi:hypothetical protein